MLKYEIKKLLFKPMILLLLLISLVTFAKKMYRRIATVPMVTENGDLSGMDAIKEYKRLYKEKFQGPLTDAKIKNDLKALKKDIKFNPEDSPEETGEKLWSSLMFQNFRHYFYWIDDVYGKEWYDLLADIEGLGDFYDTRRALLLDFEKRAESDKNVSWTPAKREYIVKMVDKNEVPFMYGYDFGWGFFSDFMNDAIYFWIVIGIAVLGVFANEDKTGMHSILLSAKNGRDMLLKTKLKAVFIMFLFTALVTVGSAILVDAISFGFDGYDLPVQVQSWGCFLPMNLFQQGVLEVVLTLFNILFVVVYAAFLSSYLKKEYGVICFILPFILRYAMDQFYLTQGIFDALGTNVLKHIRILPIFSTWIRPDFLYQFLGIPMNFYQAVILIQSLIIILLAVLTVRKVKKDYAI